MEQDINNIIDNVGLEWSQALLMANRKNAVLLEDLRLYKEENRQLKSEINRLKDSSDTGDDDK